MTIRYDNRVAIVTGAGSGLGRSHALLLAERGAKVLVNDLGGAVDGTGGSMTAAQRVVEEIQAKGGIAAANGDSVADFAGAQRMVQQAADLWGRVDIVVNNAGILRDKTLAKMDMADFETVVQVHFLGSAYVTKAAWPLMQQQNYGRVVMTSSNSGIYGNFGQSNYGGAKLAVVGMVNALKHEGGKYGILVNAIAPVAATRMTESLLDAKALAALKPDLVSPMVAWMCSEACDVTGHVFEAGAGHYARVQLVEAPGVSFDPAKGVSIEMIAENIGKICDMNGATGFNSSSDNVVKVVRHALGG
ncbi:MAG: SDR family NAD(P)-dependent oxidoreductase [Alphaproteobacteria bacterium]|jgi:NAD(P)-dependent dehydrogenase (short-subunit alcohol dehydrogenase family)|nr:SDR family NAD(P)-dependent oxidoreductase [Alphaproteobacteria bacterium]